MGSADGRASPAATRHGLPRVGRHADMTVRQSLRQRTRRAAAISAFAFGPATMKRSLPDRRACGARLRARPTDLVAARGLRHHVGHQEVAWLTGILFWLSRSAFGTMWPRSKPVARKSKPWTRYQSGSSGIAVGTESVDASQRSIPLGDRCQLTVRAAELAVMTTRTRPYPSGSSVAGRDPWHSSDCRRSDARPADTAAPRRWRP